MVKVLAKRLRVIEAEMESAARQADEHCLRAEHLMEEWRDLELARQRLRSSLRSISPDPDVVPEAVTTEDEEAAFAEAD